MLNNEKVIVTVRNNLSYRIRRWMQRCAYCVLGPTIMAKIYYRIVMKKKLHLKNPITFTEKINWYKLYYCPNNDLVVKCSDKFGVRSFLEENNLQKYMSELVGVWRDPNDIVWEELPQKFALKNSNGCGYNIICSDKSFLDETETKRTLKRWLKDHFGYYNAEPHYEKGDKCIICEEYIESEHLLPIDYKIHCMNGSPKVIQVCDERTNKTTKYVYYNEKGEPFSFGKYPTDAKLDISEEHLKEMVDVCEKAAKNFPYVRVDFFINKGNLQISELTFSPSAGLKPDLTYGDGDLIMGEMLNIKGLVK